MCLQPQVQQLSEVQVDLLLLGHALADVLHILAVAEAGELDYVLVHLLADVFVWCQAVDLLILHQLLVLLKVQLGQLPESLYGVHALYYQGLVAGFDHYCFNLLTLLSDIVAFLKLDRRQQKSITHKQHPT